MAWLQQSCNVLIAMLRVVCVILVLEDGLFESREVHRQVHWYKYRLSHSTMGKLIFPLQDGKMPFQVAVPWPLSMNFLPCCLSRCRTLLFLLFPCFVSSRKRFIPYNEQVAGGVPLHRTRGRPHSWAGVRDHTGYAAALSSAAQCGLQLHMDLYCLQVSGVCGHLISEEVIIEGYWPPASGGLGLCLIPWGVQEKCLWPP